MLEAGLLTKRWYLKNKKILQAITTKADGMIHQLILYSQTCDLYTGKICALLAILYDVRVMPWIATFFCNLYPMNLKLRPDLRIVLT